jgi:hypothetical protein
MIQSPGEYIYFERDELTSIYFLKVGNAGMVLPRHQNIKYIDFPVGCLFGIEDIVAGQLDQDDSVPIEDWIFRKESLRRQFSVMVPSEQKKCCELLTLSIGKLEQMSFEFLETFDFIMTTSEIRLRRALKIKVAAIKYCKEFIQYYTED